MTQCALERGRNLLVVGLLRFHVLIVVSLSVGQFFDLVNFTLLQKRLEDLVRVLLPLARIGPVLAPNLAHGHTRRLIRLVELVAVGRAVLNLMAFFLTAVTHVVGVGLDGLASGICWLRVWPPVLHRLTEVALVHLILVLVEIVRLTHHSRSEPVVRATHAFCHN